MCMCDQVQACSALHMTDPWIQEMRFWGKENYFIQKAADRENGRLAPQNNHPIGVWMPGSFIDQR